MRSFAKVIVWVVALISTAATPGFSADLMVTSFSAYAGQTNIALQAIGNVEFSGGLLALPDLPGGATGLLTIQAGNSIVLDTGTSIIAGRNWSINLVAGAAFVSTIAQPTPPAGGGDGLYSYGVYLDDGARLQTQNGGVNISATNEVIIHDVDLSSGVRGGAIHTLAGGNISVSTQYGDVNAGNDVYGYTFGLVAAPYYKVDAGKLGGISTAAGGDVMISAGGNVISYLPTQNDYITYGYAFDGGSGAFGPQPGNVTINADSSVFGNYVVANGTGEINAGGDAGVAATATDTKTHFALSLVAGSWSVHAQNIYLDDVMNPNGVFNDSQSNPTGAHLFDYDPNASIWLDAVDSVEITGAEVPLLPASDLAGYPIPVLLPPTLQISAGAGGLTLDTDVILFPSPNQNLNLTTDNGGNFASREHPNDPSDINIYTMGMSDSGKNQWLNPGTIASETFGYLDHGTAPPELNNPNPVQINISGSLNNVNLYATKPAQITVAGDMFNSGFVGENLHASDISSIRADGDVSFSPNSLGLSPGTKPSVPDAQHRSVGFQIGGPGQFDIYARSISLGDAYGILSCGVAGPPNELNRYANLASITPSGADLNVSVSGNLDLETSTVAAIGGGAVNVTSTGGSMDLGFAGSSIQQGPLGDGVFTSGGGNVQVVASGNIDINGSRIATYNGGNVFVESEQGNVNAGSGGTNYNGVGVSYVNPGTGAAGYYTEEVYGSGIMATTLVNPSQVPGSASVPGNITVETPHGDIATTSAGILQEKLGGFIPRGPTITLTAGSPGLPGYVGNIFLGNAGVIGGQLNFTATGNITGMSTGQPIVNAIGFYPDTSVVYGSTNPLTASVYAGTPIFSSSPTNIAIITQKTNLVVKGVGGFTVTVRVPQMTNGISIFTSNSLSLPFSSAPAPLTITANNTNRVFGQKNPAFTASYSGFVNGDKFANVFTGPPALATTATTGSLPGNNYTITTNNSAWPFKLGATNYWVTFVPGTLIIYPRTNAQSVQFVAAHNPTNLVYGTNLALTATSALPGAVVTFAVTRSSPTNVASIEISNNLLVKGVGTFTVTATTPAVANDGTGTNYSAARSSLNFTADKARLTVTDNASRTQSSTNTVFTPPIYSGFVNGDDSKVVNGNLKGTVTNKATSNTPAGTYPGYVYVSGGTLSATNYTFEFEPGTLTINPPVLTLASLAGFLGTNLLDTNELRYILTNNYAHPALVDPVTLADFLGGTNLNSVDTNDLNVFMNYFPSSGNVLPVVLAKFLAASGNIVDPAGLDVVLAHYTNWPSAPSFTSLPPYLAAGCAGRTNYCFTITNFNFMVQFSTDLAHWTNLDGPGQILFTDTNAPANPGGFYRLLNSNDH